ncbi:hypothetical protein [Lysobacter sp. D1-1-M9]|uniref:hypothetical protein n=1 Tax=Novilysobacter longmucuonensis TaxID=3098603 RepID=UPI0032032E8D
MSQTAGAQAPAVCVSGVSPPALQPAFAGAYWSPAVAFRPRPPSHREDTIMSKGMDRKKEQKKKPAKTMKEKRADKSEKKAAKPFAPI